MSTYSPSEFTVDPDLCPNCQTYIEASLGEIVLLQASLHSLKLSSDGCHLCHLLFSSLTAESGVPTENVLSDHECMVQEYLRGAPSPAAILGVRAGGGAYSSYLSIFLTRYWKSRNLARQVREWQLLPLHPKVQPGWGVGNSIFDEEAQAAFEILRRYADNDVTLDQLGPDFPKPISSISESVIPLHNARLTVFPLKPSLSQIVDKLSKEAHPYVTSSPATLELAKFWLQKCLNDHTRCRAWAEACSTMPTRVIDLGVSTGTLRLRLCEPCGLSQPYVCLSHRWGGSKIITTTNDNIDQWKQSIPFDMMPKTFQDAVLITRSLGYRYLWIDSLCIKQDCPEDWGREAANMSSIYQNGICTIVAAAATSADSGCFMDLPNEHKSVLPCRIGTIHCARKGAETSDQIRVLYTQQTNSSIDGSIENEFLHRNTLVSRGWVLQEQVLSARSLYFAADGISWECIRLAASERFPSGMPGNYGRGHNGIIHSLIPTMDSMARKFKRDIVREKRLPPGKISLGRHKIQFRQELESLASTSKFYKSMEKFYTENMISKLFYLSPAGLSGAPDTGDMVTRDTWPDIVTEFTGRDLTNESDRLQAIQGLASLLERYTSDKYRYGLWRSEFTRDLCWRVADIECRNENLCFCVEKSQKKSYIILPRRQKPALPIAPSWSWASADQRVKYRKPHSNMDYVKYISETSDDNNPTPMRLTLKGILRSVRAIAAKIDDPTGQTSSYLGKVCDPEDPYMSQIGRFWPDKAEPIDETLLCLPISSCIGLHFTKVEPIDCLLLRPTNECYIVKQTSRVLEFTRVGLATLEGSKGKFLGLAQGKAKKHGSDSGEDLDYFDDKWAKPGVVLSII